MSTDVLFTKDNINTYLKELGKEFRKLNGTKVPAEIILIGGAAVLANYGFREMTNDIDAIILSTSAMKEAVNNVGDRMGLPNGWMNMDFKKTKSFSNKLLEVSKYYRTYSNILTVRTISAEYLVAMKLMSGRRYKNDLSDIAGIFLEHQKAGAPITQEAVDNAVIKLYGDWDEIPENSKKLIGAVFESEDYESFYLYSRENEIKSKEILEDFDRRNPGKLRGEGIDSILEQARKKLT